MGGDCDKITEYRPVCLPWGLRLPITVAAETVTAYGPSTDLRRSAGEARQEGEALLREQLEALLGDTGAAESVRIDAVEQGSWLLVTLRAECLERSAGRSADQGINFSRYKGRMPMEQRIGIERMEEAINLFGSFDENIRLLETEFQVQVVNRGGELVVSGEPEKVEAGGEGGAGAADAVQQRREHL